MESRKIKIYLRELMDYKARAKNRKLKRKVTKFLQFIKFQSLNATSYHKIILLGSMIIIIGLFFPWIEVQGMPGIDKENGFSKLLGVTGPTILILNLFTIFVLLSENTKEKFKNIFNVSFKDYHPPIIGGCIIILLILNSIVTMRSLRTFSSEITFGRGVFIDLSGTIILLVGGLYLKKYYDKNVKGIYSETEEEGVPTKIRDNMKLPF